MENQKKMPADNLAVTLLVLAACATVLIKFWDGMNYQAGVFFPRIGLPPGMGELAISAIDFLKLIIAENLFSHLI